jgi:hypothetical protein
LAKRQDGQKQPIFSPNTVGIRDAKVIVGVVLRVATTSFGERLGARQSFRLSATTPPVGGKSRSQSIFSYLKNTTRSSFKSS